MNTQVQSLLERKTLVKPTSLLSELERIRRDAIADYQTEISASDTEAHTRSRATLSNLVLIVPEDSMTELQRTIDTIIDELCISFPSRFFILGYSKGETGDTAITTAVSSRCVLTNSGIHVCSEEVYIGANQYTVGHVPHLLLSLFIPDVSVISVLFGDPAEGIAAAETCEDGTGCFPGLLKGVADISDLMIFDSSNFSHYGRSYSRLKSLADSCQSHLSLRDVNWLRTKRWRRLLAEQFDSAEGAERAKSITDVSLSVQFTGADMPTSKSMLLMAWIASALGLVPESVVGSEQSMVLKCRDSLGTQQVNIHYNRRESEGVHLTLNSLELKLLGDCTIVIQRYPEQDMAEIVAKQPACSDGVCEFAARRVPFPSSKLELLLSTQLINYGNASQYKDVAKALDSIYALL